MFLLLQHLVSYMENSVFSPFSSTPFLWWWDAYPRAYLILAPSLPLCSQPYTADSYSDNSFPCARLLAIPVLGSPAPLWQEGHLSSL